MPTWWQPRHVEALQAWREADEVRLYELCEPEIRAAAKSAANLEGVAHIEGISDALVEFGQKGVRKAIKRFDPQKGAFQSYAQKDIYFETRRGAQAMSSGTGGGVSEPATEPETAAPTAGTTVVDAVIHCCPAGPVKTRKEREEFGRNLRGWVADTFSPDNIRTVIPFLFNNEARLIQGLGKYKTSALLAEVAARDVVYHWLAPPAGPPSRRRKVPSTGIEMSGPLHVQAILRANRKEHPYGPDVSDRRIARMLTDMGIPVSDKTVNAWRQRMNAAGPAPRDVVALFSWLRSINNTPRNQR